jgi:GNAT superfamily N-acetyltransferase
MLIRPAKNEDTDMLLNMIFRLYDEGAYAFLPFDHDKVKHLIHTSIDNPQTRCIFVAEEGNTIAGLFIGYLTDYIICDEKLACDVLLFVDKKYRGTTAAMRLIKEFRKWANAHHAREVCLGISTDIDAESTGKFYERMGFTRVGGIYKQRLV